MRSWPCFYRALVAFAVALLIPGLAVAQSTAFTYQGKLTNGGEPAEGMHDFRFRLYDALTGGAPLGSTQCVDNLLVTGGVFTATIDFGAQFVTTGTRFVEIEVRADTGLTCGNIGGFVVLAPRQSVTPAPLAMHAKSAFALAAADGSPANAVVVDNAGKVGIGVLAPTHTLHVGALEPTLALHDIDSSGIGGGQQVGYVSFRDNADVERAWIGYGTVGDPDLSIVNSRVSGDIILNSFSGNIGIGTTSPLAKLQVNGNIRLGASGELFAPAAEDNLRIIRGIVNSNGDVLSGVGFTSQLISTGVYRIEYGPFFKNLPTILATPGIATATEVMTAQCDDQLTSSVTVRVFKSGVPISRGFSFMAIGTC